MSLDIQDIQCNTIQNREIYIFERLKQYFLPLMHEKLPQRLNNYQCSWPLFLCRLTAAALVSMCIRFLKFPGQTKTVIIHLFLECGSKQFCWTSVFYATLPLNKVVVALPSSMRIRNGRLVHNSHTMTDWMTWIIGLVQYNIPG